MPQRTSLVKKLMRLLESGHYTVPKGWHTMTRYRPEELQLRYPPPAEIRSPEARLYAELYKYYPEARSQPILLNARRESLATEFVNKQMQLMQEGYPRREAFVRVEEQMQGRLTSLTRESSSGTFSSLLQEDEEKQLSIALDRLHEEASTKRK